jgi:ribonuclease G
MSELELLADEIDGRLHAAVVKDGRLHDLYVDRVKESVSWAALYLGKVLKVDTRLDAAIIDLGGGLTGFLPAKHVHLPASDPSETRTGIAELLKAGQTLPVQVKAEAKAESIHENHKLPRLTTQVYAFGQCLILSPLSSQVTMSRQIEKAGLFKLASTLKGKGGWIIMPTAAHANEDLIRRESESLLAVWHEVEKALEAGDKPRLLRAGPDAIERAFIDYSAFRFSHIHAGSKKVLDSIISWSRRFDPPLADSKRLRLFRPEKSSMRLFDMHDVYSALATLEAAAVPLPSGGSLIIEPTQALTVVDVNQGGGQTAGAANAEAAAEVARQARLRNLSGAIIVDFINMDRGAERARLIETLEEAFAGDPAGAQIPGFTRLGIVEITRKRRTATLAEKLKE